jgi:hypothetical protein
MTGDHLAHARGVKAAKLVLACVDHGVDAEHLEHLDNEGRDALCGLARTRPASSDTWRVVIEALR